MNITKQQVTNAMYDASQAVANAVQCGEYRSVVCTTEVQHSPPAKYQKHSVTTLTVTLSFKVEGTEGDDAAE